MTVLRGASSYPSTVLAWVATLVAGSFLGIGLGDFAPAGNPTSFWNAVAAFLALGLASEAMSIRLRIGTTSSVSFIPYLASIILLPSGWAMGIAGASELFAETVVRKKPTIKVVHNATKRIVAVGAAALVYELLGGTAAIDSFSLAVGPFAAAVLVFFLIDSGGTSVAVSLSRGITLRDAWAGVIGGSLLFDMLSTPIALLLAYLYVQVQLIGVFAVIVPLFLVRHIYGMNVRLEEANKDLLELMVKSIEARDPYTSGHSLRVSRMAKMLAQELGLGSSEVAQVETAALLHDVGKIYEEYAPLLRKEGKLTAEEFALMQTHVIRSFELVQTISSFRGGVDLAVRHHHENYDGSGYPDGLAGSEVPIASRIIMVADTVDAMTTDRPYRAALDHSAASDELHRLSGRQFDPVVVAAFRRSTAVKGYIGTRAAEPVDHLAVI